MEPEEENIALSRRERRKLQRETEKKGQGRNFPKIFSAKVIILFLVVIGVLGAGFALYRDAKKAQVLGEAVSDLGQDHVTDISGVVYNSNPPTSGPHFASWAKPGVYNQFISDGYLIHSLEHGYVIISYDCTKLNPKSEIRNPRFSVFAHETDEPHEEPANATESGKPLTRMVVQPDTNMNWFTPENPPPVEVELPESFKSAECKKLVSDLSSLTKVAERVIVIPRENLDSLIAATAWGRIDKVDEFDRRRIEDFIKTFHNRGPERTTE